MIRKTYFLKLKVLTLTVYLVIFSISGYFVYFHFSTYLYSYLLFSISADASTVFSLGPPNSLSILQ